MKTNIILFVFFLIIGLHAKATDYYFSFLTGDDGNAGTLAAPWKNLSKLNSFWANSALPGDKLLLKRGETWIGTIVAGRSGTAAAPIVLGAYGTGARPIVTQFSTVTGWTLITPNIYESAAITGGLSTAMMVVRNDIQQRMGRWPNPGLTNSNTRGGYNKIESMSGTAYNTNGSKTITDNQFSTLSSPIANWTGADVVLRVNHWLIDRYRVTSQSGGSITYFGLKIPQDAGYGYFITNHEKTLDQDGEYYYNPATKKIKMFFTGTPFGYTVEAATGVTLLRSTGKNYITIENITFRGANGHGLAFGSGGSNPTPGGNNVTIQDCDILFSGIDGSDFNNGSTFQMLRCNMKDVNNTGINMSNSTNHLIQDNSVENIYMMPGLGSNGDGIGSAINNTSNGKVLYNRIINVGFNAISVGETNADIGFNYINGYSRVKGDAGGLYHAHTSGAYTISNRKLHDNIIIDGLGCLDGTWASSTIGPAYGIYMDDNENNTEMYNNFITQAAYGGVFIHNNRDQIFRNNLLYNNGGNGGLSAGGVVIVDDNRHIESSNLNFTNNVYIQRVSAQIGFSVGDNSTTPVQVLGTVTGNVYARPTNINGAIQVVKNVYNSNGSEVKTPYTLAGWKTYSGKDQNSVERWAGLGNTNIIWFANDTKANKTFNFSGTYKTAAITELFYTNSITLAPFQAVVLIRTSIGTPAPNVSPTVSITAPANGTNYTSPASIILNASASDTDGTIASVSFWNGATLLNTDNTSPYSFTWGSVANGIYSITARATDDDGAVTISSTITVNVASAVNIPPTVSITSPLNNASYITPATFNINATASDPDGTIAKVEYYSGAVLIHTEVTAPYSWPFAGILAGNYIITAKAYDNNGAITTSTAVNVTVAATPNQAPLNNLTSPINGAAYTAPANITISNTASDPDGFISRVDYYVDTTFLHTEVTVPYTWPWMNVSNGTYVITAKAYDNNNAVTTSNSATITVSSPNVAPTVSVTSPANGSNFATGTIVDFAALAADVDGTITKVDFYDGVTLIQTINTAPYMFSQNGFTAGSHSITAKATDNGGLETTSAAVTFNIAGVNIAPTVSITSPDALQIFANPADITLTADPVDTDGTITQVEFYNGATLLNTDVSAPYSFLWEDVGIGVWPVTARATDNDGAVTISSTVNVNVENTIPVDSIVSPVQNAHYLATATVIINADAFDLNGAIVKVDFYNGSILLGTDSTFPYSYTWNNVPIGNYSLSIVTTDNDGGTSQSGQILITVEGALRIRFNTNQRLKP